MGMSEKLILLIGRSFTRAEYIRLTVMQGLIWSLADIFLVFCLLKLTNLIRSRNGKRTTVIRYLLLALSALLTPLLIFFPEPGSFFMLESIIFGIQYMILLYTLIVDSRMVMSELKKCISG